MLVFPEKHTELPAGRASLVVARGEVRRRDRGLLQSLPPMWEIPGVQCRFLSSKYLLAPRLARDARWPACAPGMGARQLGARKGRLLGRCPGGGRRRGGERHGHRHRRTPCRRRRPHPDPVGSFFPGLPPFATIRLNGGLTGGCANYGEFIH